LETIASENIEMDFPKEPKLIILPDSGCSECIRLVEEFILEGELYTKEVFLVLVKIESVKALKLRLNLDLFKKDRVFFDLHNSFLRLEKVNNYPLLISFKRSGKIEFMEEISPLNYSALSSFKNLFNKQFEEKK
jgi:hypothetical protein